MIGNTRGCHRWLLHGTPTPTRLRSPVPRDGTDLMTPEVAAALGCNRHTVYERLRTLVDRGQLETRAVGSSVGVRWRPPDPPTSIEERSGPAGERPPSAGRRDETPIRVLRVDDPRLVEQVAEFPERESDRIRAVCATSASDVPSERRIDYVVSDPEMPGMDGIEFSEAIHEDRPDLPFIPCTGRGSEETAARAIEVSVDGAPVHRFANPSDGLP